MYITECIDVAHVMVTCHNHQTLLQCDHVVTVQLLGGRVLIV